MQSRLAAIVLTALLDIAFGANAAAQRNPDTRVNTNPAGGAVCNRPRLAADGDRVHLVWHDARSGWSDVRYSRSLDRGATWLAADVQLDTGFPAGHSILPEIAIFGANLCVVWEDYRNSASNGDIYCNRSLDGGTTWLPVAVRLDTGSAPGASSSFAPQVGIDGSTICVVWFDARNGAFDIYCNRSLDGGTTWLPAAVRVDTGDAAGAAHSLAPQVVCAGGAVHVVWEDERGGNRDVYWNRSLDGGASWLPAAQRLDHAPSSASSLNARIAASGSTVCVVWEDDRNGLRDIFSNRSLDGGATWLALDTQLDTDGPGAGDSREVQVRCEGAAVHAIWRDARTFVQPQVFYRRSLDGGTTWLLTDALVNTTTATCFSSWPVLASDGPIVCIAWESQVCGGAGSLDVYCRRSVDGGTTFSPEVRLDVDPLGARASTQPAVCVEGDRCYAAWADARSATGGRLDIYWNVPFGLLPYGAGTAGSGAVVPRLAGNGTGALGSTVSLDVSLGLGGAPGAMLIGLPGSKAAIPVLGGTLLLTPAANVGLVLGGAPGAAGAGAASFPLAVPGSPVWLGFSLFFQAVFLDAGAPGGASMTNGVELWIG
jgi:hypothetical protein